MSKRTIKLLLEDILEAIESIKDYTSNISFEQFAADKKSKDAVTRNFEIIGEAASKLPKEFKKENPQIDWPRCYWLSQYTGSRLFWDRL